MGAPAQIELLLEEDVEHIDIQVLLKGRERIGWLPRAQCQEPQAPYDKEKDVIFFEDTPASYVDLVPGDFVILYPEDAHAPLIGGGGAVSKLVVKIRLH